MLFTVSVELADGGLFEYSTESILKFLQTAQMMGNTDIEEVEDEEVEDGVVEQDVAPAVVAPAHAMHMVDPADAEYVPWDKLWCPWRPTKQSLLPWLKQSRQGLPCNKLGQTRS